MTPREQLLEALLVERFAVPTRPVYDDSDITTARRRRELAEAVKEERKTA